MNPPILPNPQCCWCGTFMLTWRAVRLHVKNCQMATRPRGEIVRKRLERSQGTTQMLFDFVGHREKEKKPEGKVQK